MRVYSSPDCSQRICACYAGLIRDMLPSYILKINDDNLNNKKFTDQIFWSDNSRYSAALEWSTEYSLDCQLDVFDLKRKKYIEIRKKGTISKVHFKGNDLYFSATCQGKVVNYKVDISKLENWNPYCCMGAASKSEEE